MGGQRPPRRPARTRGLAREAAPGTLEACPLRAVLSGWSAESVGERERTSDSCDTSSRPCLGIGQRTIWAPPESIVSQLEQATDAQILVMPGATMNAHDGRQSVVITGEGEITAVVGREHDVAGWVGGVTGSIAVGAATLPFYHALSPDALANRINDCGAKLVITSDTAPRAMGW